MGNQRGGDRGRALGELATAHAVALRMRDAGASDDAIAAALDVPVEAVGPLVGVAELKLRSALARLHRGAAAPGDVP